MIDGISEFFSRSQTSNDLKNDLMSKGGNLFINFSWIASLLIIVGSFLARVMYPNINRLSAIELIVIFLLGIVAVSCLSLARNQWNSLANSILNTYYLILFSILAFNDNSNSPIFGFLLTIIIANTLGSSILGNIFTFLSISIQLFLTFARLTLEPEFFDFASFSLYIFVALLVNSLTKLFGNIYKESLSNITKFKAEQDLKNSEFRIRQDQLENQYSTKFDDISTRADHLNAIGEINKNIISIDNRDMFFGILGEQINLLFELNNVNIFSLIPNSLELKIEFSSKQYFQNNSPLKVDRDETTNSVLVGGLPIIEQILRDSKNTSPSLQRINTQSRICIPINMKGKIIAIIDMHSKKYGEYSEKNISDFIILSNNVSGAYQNLEKRNTLDRQILEDKKKFDQISSDAWDKIIHQKETFGYVFQDKIINKKESAWSPEILKASITNSDVIVDTNDSYIYALPIKIAGKSIGAIKLEKSNKSANWTDAEIEMVQELSDRLGLALESARLYQESQKQFVQDQISSDITTSIRENINLDSVLKTAVKELGEVFKATEIVIRTNPSQILGKN